jgi:hypothetical protein
MDHIIGGAMLESTTYMLPLAQSGISILPTQTYAKYTSGRLQWNGEINVFDFESELDPESFVLGNPKRPYLLLSERFGGTDQDAAAAFTFSASCTTVYGFCRNPAIPPV